MAKISKNQDKLYLDEIIGINIRLQRRAHNITREELSEMMGLSNSHLGLIERGERGTTAINMQKLTKIFNIPADYFFVPRDIDDNLIDNEEASAKANRKKIASLANLLEDSSLKFVVDTLKGVITLTKALNGKL